MTQGLKELLWIILIRVVLLDMKILRIFKKNKKSRVILIQKLQNHYLNLNLKIMMSYFWVEKVKGCRTNSQRSQK